jgi:hypothetical protein
VILEPLHDQVIGRLVITRPSSTIILTDLTENVSKFVLIETVSQAAAEAGYRPGDLVMPRAVGNIFLKGGNYHRVVFSIKDSVCRVRDVPLSEFVDSNGAEVVPVEAQEAAE